MSKQEEIRKVIDAYTDDACLYPDNNCEFRASDIVGRYCVSSDGSYNCLMKRLDEIGVVIKVDRELPAIPVLEKRLPCYKKDQARFDEHYAFKYGEQEGFKECRRKIKEAGYVANESLIKEE